VTEAAKHPTPEKAQRYRLLAAEARQAARRATPAQRDAFLAIAQQWDELATVSEQIAARDDFLGISSATPRDDYFTEFRAKPDTE